MKCNKLQFTNHCIIKMIERNISVEEIEKVIETGEVIREYPTDKPYPSELILGFIDNKPIHVVFVKNKGICIVITAYIPDKNKWNKNFKTKK